MPPAAKTHQVVIGFQGSQTLAVAINAKELEALRKALSDKPEGWQRLSSGEEEVDIDLAQVVYLRVQSGGSQVGFFSA